MYIHVDPSKFILFTIVNKETPSDLENISKIQKYLPNIVVLEKRQDTFLQFICQNSTPTLPKYRNPEKDTAELLFTSNARMDYAYKLLCQYPDATHIAYIDISVPDVLNDLSLLYSIAPLESGEIDMPGYNVKTDDDTAAPSLDSVYWHIVDKYYSGGRDAIIRLWHNYIKYLPEIVGTSLSWWMNIIGNVQHKSNTQLWKWRHCKNYTDIFFFPKRLPSISITPYTNLPVITGLHPSSISLYTPVNIANARYVNYCIRPQDKTYVFPTSNHNCITSNVCIFLDDGTSVEMRVDTDRKVCNNKWQGLEDIRVYGGENDENINLRRCKFVSTSSMWNDDGTSKITVGDYDYSTGTCRNLRFINSPVGAFCEKNWIPLPGDDHHRKFIYSWDPYRIVEIDDDSDDSRIVATSNCAFYNARGSTIFIDDGDDYVGIIHRTDSCANYFHMFVWLDRETNLPKYRSDYFYFTGVGIEYCIGIAIKDDNYVLVASVYDNNPVEIICRKQEIRKIMCDKYNI